MSVVVVGEVLADIQDADPGDAATRTLLAHPGGSPANVAVTLARLGVATRFAGRISRHGLGPWLAGHLRANGVDLALSVAAAEQPTLALVTLDGEGHASYGFYGPHTADWQWQPGELPAPEAIGAAAVHTGSLACALEPGASVLEPWLREIHDAGTALVSFDPNLRPGQPLDPGRVERLVESADLVKASADDLRLLHRDRQPVDVARDWACRGPSLVVVTGGAAGAAAVRPDGSERTRPAPPTAVVDTVGAGDAFSAALLAWLAEAGRLRPAGLHELGDAELDALVDTANAVAAITCGRPGADPPRREDVAFAPWPVRRRGPG